MIIKNHVMIAAITTILMTGLVSSSPYDNQVFDLCETELGVEDID